MLYFVTIGREARRNERRANVAAVFGEQLTETALDLLELVELGWHDCYDEITPSDDIVEDMLCVSQGDLARLIHAAHLAICDWRDLRVAADDLRHRA